MFKLEQLGIHVIIIAIIVMTVISNNNKLDLFLEGRGLFNGKELIHLFLFQLQLKDERIVEINVFFFAQFSRVSEMVSGKRTLVITLKVSII